MKKKEIGGMLRSKGISPSIQRIEIYDYLITKKNHPTVEMIFNKLSNSIPSLSKTTVYNTLNLFVQNGLANEIIIDKNELRYDANIAIHGHFMCDESGQIYDIEIDISKIKNEILNNAEIREHHIYFKGNCKNVKFK